MSGKTPGRAAYEAFQRAFPAEDWGPWDKLGQFDGDEPRTGWENIATAATDAYIAAATAAVSDGSTNTAAILGEVYAALRTVEAERDDLRALVAEMDAALGPRPNGISNPQRAKWRERGELVPKVYA
jgi:hypothetical protein